MFINVRLIFLDSFLVSYRDFIFSEPDVGNTVTIKRKTCDAKEL